jgi:hypothetical protein
MLFQNVGARAESVHKTSDSDSSIFKTSTLTPQFLKLRRLRKISVCVNNGKHIRHFITTT